MSNMGGIEWMLTAHLAYRNVVIYQHDENLFLIRSM